MSSGPLYPNQPLEEVATEVRFRGRLKVEQIRAEFQEAIEERYSTLYVPRVVPTVAPAIQHYRFESPEEACGVQVAVNSIVVYARQYPGFATFFAEASRLLGLALGMVGNVDITRVGWRYINAIPFPRDGALLPFKKVFQDQPWLSSALNGEWRALSFAAEMPFRDVSVKLRLAAGTNNEAGLESLVFDIDAFSNFDPPAEGVDAKRCESEVSRMHDAAREIFELSINEDYRSFLLGEQK